MNKSRFLAIVILLLGVSLAFSMGGGGGSSQKTFRGFEGKITDENGKTLKGVDVVLIRVDGSESEKVTSDEGKKTLSTTSGGKGRFKFMAVRPGTYKVRFSMDGYQTLEKTMKFKPGSKDAMLNIQLNQIDVSNASGGQP